MPRDFFESGGKPVWADEFGLYGEKKKLNPKIVEALRQKQAQKNDDSWALENGQSREWEWRNMITGETRKTPAGQHPNRMPPRAMPSSAPNQSFGPPVSSGASPYTGNVEEEDLITGQRKTLPVAPAVHPGGTDTLQLKDPNPRSTPGGAADANDRLLMSGIVPDDQVRHPQDNPDWNREVLMSGLNDEQPQQFQTEDREAEPTEPSWAERRNVLKEQRYGERDAARYGLMGQLARSAAQIGTLGGKRADTAGFEQYMKDLGGQRMAQGKRMAGDYDAGQKRRMEELKILAAIKANNRQNWVETDWTSDGNPVFIDRNTGETMTISDGQLTRIEKIPRAGGFHNVPGAVGAGGEPLVLGPNGQPLSLPGAKYPARTSTMQRQAAPIIRKAPDGSVMQWDEQTGQWVPAPGMGEARGKPPAPKRPVTQLVNGKLMQWDEGTGKWVAAPGVDQTRPVTTKAPATKVVNGRLMQWDGEKWVPAPGSEGSTKTAKPMSPGDIARYGEGRNAIAILDTLEQKMQAQTKNLGPFVGRAKSMNPYDTDAQIFRSDIKSAAQMIGKYLEGGVLRQEDVPKYEAMLPNMSDTPAVAAGKLKNVRELLKTRHQSDVEAAKAQGYSTEGLGAKGSVQKDPKAMTPEERWQEFSGGK